MAQGALPVKTKPMKQAAYERIEDLLNSGALRPGQLVSQRELVAWTGATLGSVREAIPRLEAEGLLQTLPQRGLMIPSLDIDFVRNAYQLRAIIELGALPVACERLPRARLAQWIDAFERFHEEAALEPDDDEAAADAIQHMDWQMHDAIVGSLGNRLVENVYRVTAIKIRMTVQSQIKVTPFNAKRVLEEHLAFLRPMAERQQAEAEAALRRHLDNSLTLALGGSV